MKGVHVFECLHWLCENFTKKDLVGMFVEFMKVPSGNMWILLLGAILR